MNGDFFNVSGTDRSAQPREIFVWCRAESEPEYVLVKTGYAVGTEDVRPPGIRVGQFSITFELPADCAIDSLIVTSDKYAEQVLSDIAVKPCT